jgi:hypothetical protein
MNQNQRHKTVRKTSHRKQSIIDSFLTSRLFIILGSILVLLGLYYSTGSSDSSNGLFSMLLSLLKPSNETVIINGSAKGLPMLILYFLPAILTLLASGIFAHRYSNFTFPGSLIAAIYLIFIQTKLWLFGFELQYFPSFFISSVFLFIPTVLLLYSAFVHRKSVILIFTTFFFYISILLYSINYGGPFDYLFPFILLFSGSIF